MCHRPWWGLTGQSAKQFIYDKLIDIAKEKLSTTDLSINEIAYNLGFEHPQSFSKLFKSKSGISPMMFRQFFNWLYILKKMSGYIFMSCFL